MVSTEMVQIEENLRSLLVDVVRRCQSTVTDSFRVTRVRNRVSLDSSQALGSHAAPPAPHERETVDNNSQPIAPITTHAPPEPSQLPPHADVEAGPSCPRPSEGVDALGHFPDLFKDSGYGSSQESCDCNCHIDVGAHHDMNGLCPPSNLVLSALTSNQQI